MARETGFPKWLDLVRVSIPKVDGLSEGEGWFPKEVLSREKT